MSDLMIAIDTREIEQLRRMLRALPQAVRDEVIDEVSRYLLNVLRAYPPHRYVSRRAAYGVPFFTDKQRRWFFANLHAGKLRIPYRRTQGLARGWHQAGQGETSFLYNDRPGAEYVIGDETQSRHEQMVGWKTVRDTIEDRGPQIERRGEAAAKRALHKLGLA